MLTSLRALSLLLFVGLQAAAGVDGVLHLCRMKEEASACKCPHAKKAKSDEAKVSNAACCDEHALHGHDALAVADSTRGSAHAPQLALAPTWSPTAAAELLPERPTAWRTGPPSHGPPLFLQIRTLLI